MKYEYSPDADVLVIRFRKGKIDHSEQADNIITHFSKDGQILEVELLDASKETVHMLQTIMKAKQTVAADSD